LRSSEHVHDQQSVAVGKRLEQPLELDRRPLVELRLHERRAASKQVGRLTHTRIVSRKADTSSAVSRGL
jgi:hypothetical protein